VTAQYLTIESKHRRFAPFLSSLADFTCRPGAMVDAEIVCEDPSISLYCFDDETQRAIFVELPADADLTSAPFLWQTQYDLAQRLIAVPYATFCELGRALPAPEMLIFMHTPGRSGTTVLSHALNCAEGVVSFSEPDVASQFVHLCRESGHTNEELREFLACSVRFLFKPRTHGPVRAGVIKLRSYAVQLMDFYQTTFPRSIHLFVYRDAASVVASYCRPVRRAGVPEYMSVREHLDNFKEIMGWDMTALTAYLDPGVAEISLPERFTMLWLAVIEAYLTHYAGGVRSLAVRYDDINSQREQMIGAILAACGVNAPLGPEMADVFARDAQAGTLLAREVAAQGNQQQLTEAERAAVDRILARHPVVRTSDFVVPGTLAV
jgi:hypothetical protein